MNFEQFEEILQSTVDQQAAQCYPPDFRLFDFCRTIESDIRRAEIELNLVLPEKYKEFMLR
jgi:hypothetical protein